MMRCRSACAITRGVIDEDSIDVVDVGCPAFFCRISRSSPMPAGRGRPLSACPEMPRPDTFDGLLLA